MALLDKPLRKALEKKWDLLQQLYEQYVAGGYQNDLPVPIGRFTIKGRTFTEVQNMLDALQQSNLFRYKINSGNILFTQIDRQKLLSEYAATSEAYRGSNEKPSFDTNQHDLHFRGKIIKIPYNSRQHELCAILFRSERSLTKEWSTGDLFDMLKEDNYDKDESWHLVYNIARELNKKISAETGIKDLFLPTKLTLQVNPRYL